MLLGIVDIGSNAIKYKIFNTKDNSLVEYYREPLRLGKDAFTQGFLSELTLKQLAIVLERFKRVFSEKILKNNSIWQHLQLEIVLIKMRYFLC